VRVDRQRLYENGAALDLFRANNTDLDEGCPANRHRTKDDVDEALSGFAWPQMRRT
jgi:hypothetical protein